jgi:hypothetical protein
MSASGVFFMMVMERCWKNKGKFVDEYKKWKTSTLVYIKETMDVSKKVATE